MSAREWHARPVADSPRGEWVILDRAGITQFGGLQQGAARHLAKALNDRDAFAAALEEIAHMTCSAGDMGEHIDTARTALDSRKAVGP